MGEQKTTIFISYKREDQLYLDALLTAVRPALRGCDVKPWVDREIAPGERWQEEIDQALAGARAAVLLISNSFLDSDYVLQKELPVLLPREQRGALRLHTVYVTRVPRSALKIPLPTSGNPNRTYDLHDIQAWNTPDRPLEGMDAAERNALFVLLAEALYADAQSISSGAGTGRPGGRKQTLRGTQSRPECWIRLHRNDRRLERDLLLPGSQRWLSPALKAEDALFALDSWRSGQAFDGDLLFQLLFGADPADYRDLLGDPYGDDPTGNAEPARWPWRIRLLIDERDADLQALPWTRIAHGGIPLAESGWTVELGPPTKSRGRPELPNHAFVMPGRTLLVFPEANADPGAAAHLRDLRGLLDTLWDRPPLVFEASDLAELSARLADSPRLVYVYGRVERADGEARLRLPDGTGGAGLSFPALSALFTSVPPSAVFLNLLGEDAVEALPQTACLTQAPGCRFVALQATPRAQAEVAQGAGLNWLKGILSEDRRLDPVSALHGNGHTFAACRTAYQEWDSQLGEAHLDEDLAQLLLDRTNQRARLLQARADFFDRASRLRVQCILAVGTPGNRLADFPQQAITHLQIHPQAGVRALLYPVEVEPSDTDVDRLDLRYRRRLGLRPSVGVAEGLRPPQVRLSNEHLLPLVAWTLAGEASAAQRQAVARAILRWSRERLTVACPDDLRVISLIALEPADPGELQALREDLQSFDDGLTVGAGYNRAPAFSFDALEPLGGVDKQHLRGYFNSEHCTCPDDLRLAYPDLLLKGRYEMPFEDAVALIRKARDRGWHAMKTDLERQG